MLRQSWLALSALGMYFVPDPIPSDRLNRVQRSLRRRVEDAVEDVFQRACETGDLATAEELLGVLEDMHERRRLRIGGDRRINDDALVKARAELLLRKQTLSDRRQ